MRFIVMAFVLTFSGCGKDESDTSEAPADNRAMLVADAAAMPACDEDSQDRIVYVQSESKLKACNAGAWGDVALAGSTMIANQWSCGETDDLGDGTAIGKLGMGATITKFTSGDFAMSCSFAAFSADYADTEGVNVFAKASADLKTVTCGKEGSNYITAVFTIETGVIKYTDNTNKSRSQDVTCTKS